MTLIPGDKPAVNNDLEILRYIDGLVAGLRSILDERYFADQKALDAAFAAAEKALTKAELSLERRLDLINMRLNKLERQTSGAIHTG